MNLSPNNFFARFYNWSYNTLPNDLCSFFWGTLAAILLFPFSFIGWIFQRPMHRYVTSGGESKPGTGFTVIILYAILVLVGTAITTAFVDHNVWTLLTVSPLVAALVITAFYFFAKFGTSLESTDFVQNTKDWIGAIRGKYCTKINWKK